MRKRPFAFAVLAATASLLATTLLTAPGAAADPPAPPGTPTAQTFSGTPTVGPLFESGLTHRHGCTASVISSPHRDLILTAAHCVSGTAAGWQFAPGYDAGKTPYGVWTVTHAYVDPSWISAQDPQHDYAILQVADQQRGRHLVGVQQVTGGNRLWFAPRPGQRVTDVAYNSGINDQPIRCTVPTYLTSRIPVLQLPRVRRRQQRQPVARHRSRHPDHAGQGCHRRPAPGRLLRVHLVLVGVQSRHLPAVAAGLDRVAARRRAAGRRRRLLSAARITHLPRHALPIALGMLGYPRAGLPDRLDERALARTPRSCSR